MTPLLKRPDQFEAFRIKDGDSNRLVIIFDSTPERKLGFIACVEIFDVGGFTPPNSHRDADELFFIIEGNGRARILGEWREINKGDALVVTAGDMHELENLGNDRRNCSPGVQLPHGGLRGFPLKRLNQRVQQIDALLA
jgi:mannose-6-phosphate isomerase-like protein (cupin superfamily)